jgi:hypothetical protein
MVLFSQVAGNVLNLVTSGHLQTQNQPGNKQSLEWDRFMPPDSQGRHNVSQNPLGRQVRDFEKLMGIDYKSKNPVKEFLADRLGPILEFLTKVANVDLHQSLHDGSWVHVDPTAQAEVSPLILAVAMSSFLPAGQAAASGLEGAAQDTSLGPWNTKKPKSVLERGGNLAKTTGFGIFGLNAPYTYQQPAGGTPITSDQWFQVNKRQNDYASTEKQLSDALLSGAMAPDEWASRHKAVLSDYQHFLSDTFKDAPYYTSGPLGLYHQWVGLYDKAKDQYGQIDWAKYDELEANFEATHTGAEMDALRQQRAKSELQIPAVKMFRDVTNAYRNFQQDAASQIGVDVNKLRAALASESHLRNDQAALNQFRLDHPELAEYTQLKRRYETSTVAGVLFGLYYDSGIVARWLMANGMTPQQVIQRAEQIEQQSGGATP